MADRAEHERLSFGPCPGGLVRRLRGPESFTATGSPRARSRPDRRSPFRRGPWARDPPRRESQASFRGNAADRSAGRVTRGGWRRAAIARRGCLWRDEQRHPESWKTSTTGQVRPACRGSLAGSSQSAGTSPRRFHTSMSASCLTALQSSDCVGKHFLHISLCCIDRVR